MQSLNIAFLRPEFTSQITNQLLAGESINLISPHGQGRRRTLHDLRQNLPSSLQVFHINMRIYKHDYKAFYTNLFIPDTQPSTAFESFDILLNHIEARHQKNLLILHNFDELRKGKEIDRRYDEGFFLALNSIKQRRNMALLCVSTIAYKHYRLHADGSGYISSQINADPIPLPALNATQMLAELHRRDTSHAEQELHVLSQMLIRQSAPYSALEQRFPV